MSTPTWHAPAPVISTLLASPHRFGFFQAVRLLERWVGLERVQFHNSTSLAFPASEIESLQAHWTSPSVIGLPPAASLPNATDVQRIDMTPACMGLLGVSGALPLFYTEWLAQAELRGRHAAPRAFLDLFSHRSVMLFYQAWAKHRLALRYEQQASRHRSSERATPPASALLSEVLALSGMGLKGLRHRLGAERAGVADEALAYFGGILQRRTVPMAQVQQLLTCYLGVSVDIEPFVGRWYPVPADGRTVLGGAVGSGLGRRGAGGASAAGVLGRTALLGERVWQRNLCIRLVLGPLNHATLLRFLPGGAGALALRQWLALLLGPALDVEVRLRLQHDAVHGCHLDSVRPPQTGRLGWDTFLLSRPATSNRQDVQYDLRLDGGDEPAVPATPTGRATQTARPAAQLGPSPSPGSDLVSAWTPTHASTLAPTHAPMTTDALAAVSAVSPAPVEALSDHAPSP